MFIHICNNATFIIFSIYYIIMFVFPRFGLTPDKSFSTRVSSNVQYQICLKGTQDVSLEIDTNTGFPKKTPI